MTGIVVGVICIVRHAGNILLIKRAKPPYIGLYALPGGKIECGEHPKAAALREVKEETGLDTKFERVLGVMSETLESKQAPPMHFVLFVCELTASSEKVVASNEGELTWMKESQWSEVKREFIPSDWHVVRDFLFEKNSKMELREVKICERNRGGEICYDLEEFTST